MNCPKKFWPSCEFSPNLELCPKFAEPNIYQFADHINEGKTVALSRQSDQELGMMKSLRRNRPERSIER